MAPDRKLILALLAAGASLLWSSAAFAWTFDEDQCSPPSEQDLSKQTPNIYLMVDHSRSMNEYAKTKTCHVCNVFGRDQEVDSAADCTGFRSDYDGTAYAGRASGTGYEYSFSIPLDPADRGDARLELESFLRINEYCDEVTVIIEGRSWNIRPRYGQACGAGSGLRYSINVPASALADGSVDVTIRTASNGRYCDGTQRCSPIDFDRTEWKLTNGYEYKGYQENYSVCGYETKWEQAVNGLTTIATDSDAATPQIAKFGYGTFESATYNELACAADNGDDVVGFLNARTTACCNRFGTCFPNTMCVTDWGSTAIADAITTSYASTCFDATSPPTPAAAILITDGNPTVRAGGSVCDYEDFDCYERAAVEAVYNACATRTSAPLFTVGLGSGTDQEFNNVLAAASRTGTCMNSSGVEQDPCSNIDDWVDDQENWRDNIDGWTCEGSFQVDDGDQLLDALENITSRLACTFAIDFLRSGATSVPEDPDNNYEYLAVALYGGGTSYPVYNQDSSLSDPPGEGWSFTNEDRQFVEFSDHYCNQIQVGTYSKGVTQLACLCEEPTGDRCDVPNYEDLGLCPEGTWVCMEGTDVCEADTDCCTPDVECMTGLPGECALGRTVCENNVETCVPNNEPTDEVCDNLDNDCDGLVDENLDGEDCTVAGGSGRCGTGSSVCSNGMLSCTPNGAMPEVCNGIDDDCDGSVDNMEASWSDPAYSGMKPNLTNAQESATCNFNDVCACPNGPAPVSGATTVDAFFADYEPICMCGEGLGADDDGPQSIGEPSTSTPAPAAGCTTARSAGDGFAGLLVLGLMAFGRRRR